eukprot:m.27940 g.27940  ORF g.27940 m.27940 type:complete len:114 (+) comp5994_c0_seq2:70-411(+)
MEKDKSSSHEVFVSSHGGTSLFEVALVLCTGVVVFMLDAVTRRRRGELFSTNVNVVVEAVVFSSFVLLACCFSEWLLWVDAVVLVICVGFYWQSMRSRFGSGGSKGAIYFGFS